MRINPLICSWLVIAVGAVSAADNVLLTGKTPLQKTAIGDGRKNSSDWAPPFFDLRPTFAQTMFATRSNCYEQVSRNSRLAFGPWFMKPCERSLKDVVPETLAEKVLDGNAVLPVGWVRRDDIRDGAVLKNPQSAIYARLIESPSASSLLIKTAEGARIWLNGKEEFPLPRSPYRDKTQFFRVEVPAGENVLQVFIIKSQREPVILSVNPDFCAEILMRVENEYPYQIDWLLQDATEKEVAEWLRGKPTAEFANRIILKAVAELGDKDAEFHRTLQVLLNTTADDSPDWLYLYQKICEARRAKRLAKLIDRKVKIIFVQNWDFNEGRCSHADTSDYSGIYKGRFKSGSELRQLSLVDLYGVEKSLIEDSRGMIRDPAISYDGHNILFSWRKSQSDDFHLYEYDTRSCSIRQLTRGQGIADIEGVYLPNGDIVFGSTRCFIAVDCMGHPTLNLFRCDANGKRIRRLGFDQVTTDSPGVLEDGRIVFSRWEYNDRNPVYQTPLMQMNPDGTGQAGYYNNNWSSPTTLHHAKAIPYSRKIIAIASGHHTGQAGKLVVIDRVNGLEGAKGLQFVAPVSSLDTNRPYVDGFGQDGVLYQYPFPLSEDEYLVSCASWGHRQSWSLASSLYGAPHFGIYYLTKRGERELLVKKSAIACRNPCLLTSRPRPPIISDRIDPSKSTGVVFLQDVYAGSGLTAVPRGTAKRLRIVALDYKAMHIGMGKIDGWDYVTPISINGSWDVKKIIGEVDIHDDGSAMFEVPAREAFYFQILDARGYAIQSMRSWTTLMPGEYLSCVGCHEQRQSVSSTDRISSMAMRIAPQKPRPFYGSARGFSFIKEIQPILDRHCISCHKGERRSTFLNPSVLRTNTSADTTNAFSLSSEQIIDDRSKRKWSIAYLELLAATTNMWGSPRAEYFSQSIHYSYTNVQSAVTPLLSWLSPAGPATILPPYHAGSARSRLLDILRQGHHNIKLSQAEIEKIACWIDLGVPYCGDYLEANAWSKDELAAYQNFLKKRDEQEKLERNNYYQTLVQTETALPSTVLEGGKVFDKPGDER